MYFITSTPTCSYCKRAKELLTRLGLPFEETLLETPEQKAEFFARGFSTVPQIWVATPEGGREHIGGYAELTRFL